MRFASKQLLNRWTNTSRKYVTENTVTISQYKFLVLEQDCGHLNSLENTTELKQRGIIFSTHFRMLCFLLTHEYDISLPVRNECYGVYLGVCAVVGWSTAGRSAGLVGGGAWSCHSLSCLHCWSGFGPLNKCWIYLINQ